jgi:DNA helicase HerA-like ATPase
MAYDRLEKEGRKFGISMLLCTQRPSELSETVLSQCGTLFVFRLTSSKDKAIVNAASEIQEILFQDLSMLQRGELVATGIAFNFPIRVLSAPADPPPHAADYEYAKMWSNPKS